MQTFECLIGSLVDQPFLAVRRLLKPPARFAGLSIPCGYLDECDLGLRHDDAPRCLVGAAINETDKIKFERVPAIVMT